MVHPATSNTVRLTGMEIGDKIGLENFLFSHRCHSKCKQQQQNVFNWRHEILLLLKEVTPIPLFWFNDITCTVTSLHFIVFIAQRLFFQEIIHFFFCLLRLLPVGVATAHHLDLISSYGCTGLCNPSGWGANWSSAFCPRTLWNDDNRGQGSNRRPLVDDHSTSWTTTAPRLCLTI